MATRRQFLTGLLATGLIPAPSWADAGAPEFLSAARLPDGRYALCGITAAQGVCFRVPLPGRGHAAAAHPTRPEAVAFARRPGTFALVLECVAGQAIATLSAPEGRHFYGHGAFSADGRWLYTTENDYEAGRGCIGVWDSARGYARIDEWDSGGVGPHDIKRMPGSDRLVVANGGIETHPEAGRAKLNLPTMAPNLAYIDAGEIVETAALEPALHKNSIRHLAVSRAGQVATGLQWQGAGEAPCLLGLHRVGEALRQAQADPQELSRMQNYVGSVAFSADERQVITTSPRGGVVQSYDAATGQLIRTDRLIDACGVATAANGVVVSSGTGRLISLGGDATAARQHPGLQWDNHLVAIETLRRT